MEFTSQLGGLHCPLQQTKQVSQSYWKFIVTDFSQPSIPMDFQKIRKKKQSNWHHLPDRPARGEEQQSSQRGRATGHHPAPRYRLPNPSSTVSSVPCSSILCQSGHSFSQIIICITYYPSIPVRETGPPCYQPPRGNTIRRSEEVPRAIKLTKK